MGSHAAGGRPKELPKVFTSEEVEQLLAVPNLRAPTGLRNRAMLESMLRCGLRVSESCGLHLRDVQWAEAKIHVRGEVGKGELEAVVYLDERTKIWLERWIAERRRFTTRKQPHLFTTLQGGPVDRRYVWSMIRRYARRAGIDRPVGPHMLRHTFATQLLASGDFNMREVQTLLRHQDIRTTEIYTHLVDAELAAKIRARR